MWKRNKTRGPNEINHATKALDESWRTERTNKLWYANWLLCYKQISDLKLFFWLNLFCFVFGFLTTYTYLPFNPLPKFWQSSPAIKVFVCCLSSHSVIFCRQIVCLFPRVHFVREIGLYLWAIEARRTLFFSFLLFRLVFEQTIER